MRRGRGGRRRTSPSSPSTIVGLHRPRGDARADLLGEARNRRQHAPRAGPTRSAISATVSPKGSISRLTSLAPAARQDEERSGSPGAERRPLARRRAQHVEPLDQRMADIGAGRTAEPPVDLRLERQDRQQLVDEAAPSGARGPAARPRPSARRSRRSGSTAAPCRTRRADAEVEAGAVDETSTSGLGRRRPRRPSARMRATGCAAALATIAGDAVERDLLHRKERAEAEARHARCRRRRGSAPRRRAARLSAAIRPAPSASPDSSPAMRNTVKARAGGSASSPPAPRGELDADDEHAGLRRPRAPSAARSTIITRPASTAMPARPAAATASTVFGPMVGMSTRRSCCGLAHLARTPARPFHRTRPRRAELADPLEHRVGALRRLERDDAAVDRDRRLPGVDARRSRARRAWRAATSRARRLPGRVPADRARRRDQVAARPRGRRRRG